MVCSRYFRRTASFGALIALVACDQAPTAVVAHAKPQEEIVLQQLQQVLVATQGDRTPWSQTANIHRGRGALAQQTPAPLLALAARLRESDRDVNAIVARFAASPVSVTRVANALRAGRHMSSTEVKQLIASYQARNATSSAQRATPAAELDAVFLGGRLAHTNQAECEDVALAIYYTTQDYHAAQEDAAYAWDEVELASAAAWAEPSEWNLANLANSYVIFETDEAYVNQTRLELDILATMYSAYGCWN